MTANNHSGTPDKDPPAATDWGAQAPSLAPLPGELGIPNVATKQPSAISKKALLALVLLLGLLVAVSGASFQRWVAGSKKPGDADTKTQRDKPAAALAEPRRLDMPALPLPAAAAATAAPALLYRPCCPRQASWPSPSACAARAAARCLVRAFPQAAKRWLRKMHPCCWCLPGWVVLQLHPPTVVRQSPQTLTMH
jgi:hypothetical protein